MKVGFICSDNERIKFGQCFERCRMGQRCLTLPTLKYLSYSRPWTGKPSTTQCINGTRMEYLKLTCDYYIRPKDAIYSLLGTRHHHTLQSVTDKMNVLAEETLEDEVTGIADLLEVDENDNTKYVLTDYKCVGSYKVAMALGLEGKKVPSPDEVYQKSGAWGKAGTPKMITEWTQNPIKADTYEWDLQLNNYRLMFEQSGFPVSRIQIQATVRDGNTMIAENRGVTEPVYIIPIARLSDKVIRDYFSLKSGQLLDALSEKKLPPLCDNRESWEGRRCDGYCDVEEFCKGK